MILFIEGFMAFTLGFYWPFLSRGSVMRPLAGISHKNDDDGRLGFFFL